MIPKNVQMPNPNPKYKPPGTTGGGRGGNRMKCSGKNCPMQHPYDVKACVFLENCPYATLIPCTNADRIRAMSDEELAEELVIEIEGLFPSLVYVPMATGNIYISRDKAEKEMLEYLQQPAEEET